MTKEEFYKQIKWGYTCYNSARTIMVPHPETGKNYILTAVNATDISIYQMDKMLEEQYIKMGGKFDD